MALSTFFYYISDPELSTFFYYILDPECKSMIFVELFMVELKVYRQLFFFQNVWLKTLILRWILSSWKMNAKRKLREIWNVCKSLSISGHKKWHHWTICIAPNTFIQLNLSPTTFLTIQLGFYLNYTETHFLLHEDVCILWNIVLVLKC